MILLGSALALAALAPGPRAFADQSGGASSVERPPLTKDRLPPERMRALVAGPISIVEKGDVSAGTKAFADLLAAAIAEHGRNDLLVADLLMSFGVLLYEAGLDGDDPDLKSRSLRYLEDSIPVYRAVFGPSHPEVALALNSYADVAIILSPDDPPAAAEHALQEAYEIRLKALGSDNVETRNVLSNLLQLRALKSRTNGDSKKIDAVVQSFRTLVESTPNDPDLSMESRPMRRFSLARALAQNGRSEEAAMEASKAIAELQPWPEPARCLQTAIGLNWVLSEDANGAIAERMTNALDAEQREACLTALTGQAGRAER